MALDNGYFGVFGRKILLDAKGLFGGNVSKKKNLARYKKG